MRVTIGQIREMKDKGEKIPMLTAYDFVTAKLVDQAGIPLILVGDSLGMVMLGYESTIPVTMDEMIHHTKAVVRGTQRALIIGDMPFMTYHVSAEEAQTLLEQLVKEEPIVHAVSAMGVPYIGLLCNCDMQVCSPYLSRLRLGITSPFYKAHHRAQINKQSCNGCGICANVCPFQVADFNQLENIAKIDSNACYGCGICLRHCTENAISLVPVDESLEF